jgi:serine/threonine-protein kinase HipA
MKSPIEALEIRLYNQPVGIIANLPTDKNKFTFNENYIADKNRPTVSLSFKDYFGDLITQLKTTQTRLSPFFSNLLPEGPLRDYLASHANVHGLREFHLIKVLGLDLPGALEVRPVPSMFVKEEEFDYEVEKKKMILRFSLAGVQLKFSANLLQKERLTIPANGVGGSWIVKLPSAMYPGVTENEYAMMELARRVGIDVPETKLIPIENVQGLPDDIQQFGQYTYAIKRFDRGENKEKIHIEDFAQVFGVYSDDKYKAASYRNIVELIAAEVGDSGIEEFVRRFIFNALIGNGDMHLKNWSLIYHDKYKASLSPAYDFVSTIPYIPNDQLALNFAGTKKFSSLTEELLKQFSAKAKISQSLFLDTTRDTIKKFRKIWKESGDKISNQSLKKTINNHLMTIPMYTGR